MNIKLSRGGIKVDPAPRRAPALAECPSCAGIDIVVRRCLPTASIKFSNSGKPLYQAACMSCGVRGPEVTDRGLARDDWNHIASRKVRS